MFNFCIQQCTLKEPIDIHCDVTMALWRHRLFPQNSKEVTSEIPMKFQVFFRIFRLTQVTCSFKSVSQAQKRPQGHFSPFCKMALIYKKRQYMSSKFNGILRKPNVHFFKLIFEIMKIVFLLEITLILWRAANT